METLSHMESAGSSDSVISMNSGYSQDSMEHLSAEERACIMYLEATIEALEVEEDSGFSNDELDSGLLVERSGGTKGNYISSFNSESGRPKHHILNHTSEPECSAANTKDLTSTSLTKPNPPATETPSATQSRMLCVSIGGDGNPKIVTNARISPGQTAEASKTALDMIPPPSDFMDKPGSPAQLVKIKSFHSPARIPSTKAGAPVDLEQLRQRAYGKKAASFSVTQENPNRPPPEVSPSLSQPLVTTALQMSSLPEPVATRSPPVVAPKPMKLPANILMRSQKASVQVSDGNSGHSVPTSSERALSDLQRAHTEALRKLGLLKSDEPDSDPGLNPKLSPQTRSWAAPPSPVSPAASHTPPVTPSDTHINTPPPASVPLQSPAVVFPSADSAVLSDQLPDILPVPAAFSDLSTVKDVYEVKGNAQVYTPPVTPPTLTRKLTPPKIIRVRSATLEHSDLGLRSYMDGEDSIEAAQGFGGEQSPGQLRNSRPRPFSLGSRKEFSSGQGEGLQVGHAASKEPNSRRSLPVPTTSQDSNSQKLPRSQGISVLIRPRAENGEDRRKALKTLGLLRD